MTSFIKKYIYQITIILVACLSFTILYKQNSKLKKENEEFKSKTKQNEQYIDSLKINISKLETIIKEKNKQQEIEDKLLEKKQNEEKKLTCEKNDKIEKLEEIKRNNYDVKSWCDEPLPNEISSILNNIQ